MSDQTVFDKSHEDIDIAYGFAAISKEAKIQGDMIRESFRQLAHAINEDVPNSREKSLAMTNLQQAKMWAVQAIVNADMEG